jgi:hypothetical protein
MRKSSDRRKLIFKNVSSNHFILCEVIAKGKYLMEETNEWLIKVELNVLLLEWMPCW